MKIKKHENVLAGLANPHMSTKSHDQKSAKFRKCKNQGCGKIWQKNVLVNFQKKWGPKFHFSEIIQNHCPGKQKQCFCNFKKNHPNSGNPGAFKNMTFSRIWHKSKDFLDLQDVQALNPKP